MGRNPKKKSSKKKSGGGGGSKHDSDDEWEEGITTITGEESGDEMMDEDGGDPDRCAPPSNPVHVLDPNPAVASRTPRGCSSRRPHRSISRVSACLVLSLPNLTRGGGVHGCALMIP